ncbi:putative bifunctional diguanylate cyclase/phosphodiesterase [Nitrincola iocasae]|uniref:cyclic-guanylate-specific phosphodiesterase n=1 Tax=Nitrincola iocasae TaxID=2614693 RepID=A0A5J6LHN3_9GAMM|nr:GGDEF domain-containing phosphodiesterase [Nitrincola iocasae]QEW08137.1 EAL domain-containing protein [Nitrincola iocasae]
MRAGKTVLLMFLLPAVLMLVLSLLIGLFSLNSLKSQYIESSDVQADDLQTLHKESTFKRDISELHSRVVAVLDGARKHQFTDIQLYREHSQVVNDLAAIELLVKSLAESNLLREVNHNSVQGLQQSFSAYRSLVIMATEIAAIDPDTADSFFLQAQASFNEFSVFTGRISMLLTDRTMLREHQARIRHERAFLQIFIFSLAGAVVVLLMVFVIAFRISGHVRDIADALSKLSYNTQTELRLPAIEHLKNSSRGEFGRIARVLLGFRDDMVRRIQAEQENHRLIFYDALTGLPNRRLLQEQLQYSAGASSRVSNYHALLWLDIDRFKTINDIRGHQAGDQLLVMIAGSMRLLLKEGDLLARVGGDEFAILLELPQRLKSEAAMEAERVALDICASVAKTYEVEGHSHYLTASIGIVLFSDKTLSSDDLLNQAEVAKYQAKDAGRNTVCFYDPNIQAEINRRAELEGELRTAIEHQELRLFYQLQYDQEARPVGAEALLRWQHPQRGLVSPADFIPLAEETGLIITMGEWVLVTACELLAQWQEDEQTRDLQLAVNVSAKQFRQPKFVEMVLQILQQTGARADQLKLELTESAVLEDIEQAIQKMQQLRGQGVTFAMDDFGTGYSSLQYLKRLPLDQIKIDQSFVRDIVADPDDAVIIRTIIAMGQALSIEVIAEGVETAEQRDLLLSYGCLRYQGYLFARPRPISECMMLLKTE